MDNLKPRCSGKRVVVKLFVHDNCHRQVFANLLNTVKLHYCTNNTLDCCGCVQYLPKAGQDTTYSCYLDIH